MKTWFSEHLLRANADKFYVVASLKISDIIRYYSLFDIKVIKKSMVRFLGIIVDNRLNFDYQVSQLCKKAI